MAGWPLASTGSGCSKAWPTHLPRRSPGSLTKTRSRGATFAKRSGTSRARFRARGGRTAMLSNGVREIIARIRAARPLGTWFDAVIVSSEVGCSKPDPAIYRICIDRLGVPPAESLFVDDRAENIAAAQALGLQTLHFTDEASVSTLRRIVER